MSMGKQDGLDRRSACSVLGLLAGAIAMIGTRVPAQAGSLAKTGSADDFPFGRTDEHDLSASDPSLSPRLRALIRIGEDGIARENKGALADFFHPQYRFHGPGAAELDREGLWDYFARCRAAFDDFTVTRQAAISDGTSYIACRTRFSGRFVRPFTGMGSSSLEPNGRMIEYRPINIFHYAVDGRLVEEWVQYDVAAFLAELQHA
jgi:predicted ester cyclase